jgi:hypothetical protein
MTQDEGGKPPAARRLPPTREGAGRNAPHSKCAAQVDSHLEMNLYLSNFLGIL